MQKLHPLLCEPVRPRHVAGLEHPMALLESIPERREPLMALEQRSLISARQFDPDTVAQICRLAAHYETTPALKQIPLTGKILISVFYEPSTRTRLSFESAWHRLGGDVMSITDSGTTAMAKGESLADVAEMFNNYGDVVVLRDSSEKAVYEMLESLYIPIVNAGNGIDEHPTQALADIYTMFKWRPKLIDPNVEPQDRITIGIIGVPGRMRTIRSLLLFLSMFSKAIKEIVIVSDCEDVFSERQKEELEAEGLCFSVTNNLQQVLPMFDITYINSIAWVGDSFEKLGQKLRLSSSSPLKEGSIILHPLARGPELATDLDTTPHNWYFSQARGAVFIRMAILTCMVHNICPTNGSMKSLV